MSLSKWIRPRGWCFKSPLTIIGALGGGAAGAFAGAYYGEEGSGKTPERVAIGKGALIGQLLGTAGKLIIGIVMLVIVTLDSFYDFAELP